MVMTTKSIQSQPDFQPRNRVAVVLNGNAKAVTGRVIRDVRGLLKDGPSSLYVSHSLDEAEFIARSIVRRGFDVVLSGGGDGTFSQLVTDIKRLRPQRMPAFGVLRLGTGNSMASTLGAAGDDCRSLAADIERAELGAAQSELGLLEVEGRLAPFAGVGLDSLILSDYNSVKRSLADTPLRGLGQGGPGYAMAIATRTLWRFISSPLPEVIIRNHGAPVQKVDINGRTIGRVPRGGIIHQGPIAIAATSTIPFYGFDLRMFPQIDQRNDRFQLRVGKVRALSVLSQLPALFRGTFTDPGISDYFCTDISIELNSPMPLQISGDDVGERKRVRIKMSQVQAVRGSKQPISGTDALTALRERTALRVAARVRRAA
jgi:diacylglycerol kinase family enzyme